MYGNPIEIPKIKNNQFRVLRSLILGGGGGGGEMVSFGNSARIASLCVGFHPSTLHGYIFYQDFWSNLNFLLEHQIKLVLICFTFVMMSPGSKHKKAPVCFYR